MSVHSSESNQISIHDMEWKGLELTQPAAKRIAQLAQQGRWFHLSVRPSGCTGFAYEIALIDSPASTDLKFCSQNVEFLVALNAMPMIDGTQIDYVRQGLNSSFVYHNPNVKNVCGCGESFGV